MEEWGYKVGKDHNKVRLLCSWHCLRAWKKAREGQPVKRHGSAKEERNREIYRRYKAGETPMALSKIYGVEPSTINQILRRVELWIEEETST